MIFIAQHAERCPSHSLLATKQKHSEKDTSCNANYGFIMIIIKLIFKKWDVLLFHTFAQTLPDKGF